MNREGSTPRRVECAADLCLVAALLLPIPAVWSWLAGVGDLLALAIGGAPRAPVTGVLQVAAAAAVIGLRFGSDQKPRGGLAWVLPLAMVMGALAVLGLARPWLGLPAGLEPWFTGIEVGAETEFGVHGHGVLHAVFLILAATLAVQTAPVSAVLRRRVRFLVGIGVALFGLAVVGGHAAGSSQFQAGQRVLGAAWMGVEFLLLGFGLAASPGSGQWRAGLCRRLALPRFQAPVAAGGLTLLLAGLLGAWYVHHEQRLTRAARRAELQAISNLKVTQITNWWNERLMDARFFAGAAFVARDIATVMRERDSAKARDEALHWLRLLKAGDRYDRVQLFDHLRRVVLTVSEPGEPPSTDLAEAVATAVRADRVRMFDLHRDPADGRVRMEVGFSVLPEGAPEGVEPLGYILLRLDPSRFLYPLVQSWPIPSPTAETLVVRREGDDVVYLNTLRFREGLPLTRRVPVDPGSRVPAVRAVLGTEGVIEGTDYRGARVLAAVRRVPGTGWHMVSKVDFAEAFGPLTRQALLTFCLVLVMAGLAGLGTGLFVQRQEHAMERGRLALAERLALLMRHANDIFIVLDEDWRIVEGNDRALETYGYGAAELQALTLRDLRAPETRAEFDSEAGLTGAPPMRCRETVHRRKDGTTFPVEASQQKTVIDGRVYRQVIVRDITERREKDARWEQANRSLRTLSEVGRALVRLQDERLLLEEVCRILVDEGGYRMAWVGFAEQDPEASVRPVASAGAVDGYLETVRATWRDTERGGGPSGLAIRTGRPCVIQDLEKDARFAPWRDEAVRRGYRSSIALPLRDEGGAFGALRIYSDRPEAFDATEEKLLADLAEDLAYGLRALRVRAERDRAMESLRRREELFRCLFESHVVGIVVADPTGAITEANDTFLKLLGYRRSDLPLSWERLAAEEWGATGASQFAAVAQGGESGPAEREWVGRGGRRVPVLVGLARIPGNRPGVVGFVLDRTAQRALERDRTELQMRLQQQGRLEAIGTLAGGVAHEINNPVNGVINFAQLILDDAPAGSPTAEYAGEIMVEAGRVAEIVRNLLQFARQERRARLPMRLHEVVGSTLALMGTVLRHDRIQIRNEVPGDLPPVIGRVQQIQQVLMSLLSNARDALNEKYTGSHPDKCVILGGAVIERDRAQWLRLTVEDHGTGIAPEHQGRVFDPYFTTKPAERASGLGLRVGRDLAREHRGELSFETSPGEWTRFHLDLPLGAGVEEGGNDGDGGRGGGVLVDDQ